MKEDRTLMNLDLKVRDNKTEELHHKGLKFCLFRFFYLLLENEAESVYLTVLFTVLEFIQIFAFAMDKVFASGWKRLLFGTVGNFLRYFQLIFLWERNSQFYITAYVFVVFYISVYFFLGVVIIVRLSNGKMRESILLEMIEVLIFFEQIMNIPFNKVLFSVFSCEQEGVKFAPDIKCKSDIHYGMMIVSTVFILVFLSINLLLYLFKFEFGI